jgi:hypothetical protein
VERFSARLWFSSSNCPVGPAAGGAGLLITGFFVPAVIGAVALLLVGIFLGWLAYLSWPSINRSGRAGASSRRLHAGDRRLAGQALTGAAPDAGPGDAPYAGSGFGLRPRYRRSRLA